jgi:hypothetical protein
MPRLTGSLDLTGLLIVTGSVKSTGSIELSGSITITNDSGSITLTPGETTLIQPIIELTLNGSASYNSSSILSTNSTSTASYGINVVSNVTETDYCCVLPAPSKGKTVSFVNNGGAPFYVFSSVEEGEIDGVINGNYQVPNDGRQYDVTCWENPLPGGWSTTIAPGGVTTYRSGIVYASLGPSGSNYQYLTFVNNSVKASGSALGIYNYPDTGIGFLNHPPAILYPTSNSIASCIYPGLNTWGQITDIIFRTNLTGSINLQAQPYLSGDIELYNANTTILASKANFYSTPPYTLNNLDPNFSVLYTTIIEPFLINNLGLPPTDPINYITPGSSGEGWTGVNYSMIKGIIPGTFFSGQISNPYTCTVGKGVGRPGTAFYKFDFSYFVYQMKPFKYIGTTYLGSFTNSTSGQQFDVYYSTRIGMALRQSGLNNSGNPLNPNLTNLRIITEYIVTP